MTNFFLRHLANILKSSSSVCNCLLRARMSRTVSPIVIALTLTILYFSPLSQPTPAYADDPIFSNSNQYLGDSSTQAVALGDLDGDGDLDAFVANVNQPNKVWLNDGHSTFNDSAQELGDIDNPSRRSGPFIHKTVALGDLEGDGDLDAFVTNSQGPNTVLLNDGHGTFSDSGQSLGNSLSSAVALGDLDGDGDLDAFVTNYGAANKVWLNDGGTFNDSGQSLGNSNSKAIALGDLDRDGDLDAFVANEGVPDEVWLNDAGTFSNSGLSLGDADRDSEAVALADLDGDGDLDAFVVGNHGTIWLNDGDGNFTSTLSLDNLYGYALALGDMDGDGDLDAFVGNSSGQPNTVWLNGGSGIFSDSAQTLEDAFSGADGDMALGDLDGDDDLDAFVANSSDQPNTVWLNDGSGAFSDSGQRLGSFDSQAVALGDLDGDGDLDAFVGNVVSDTVWLNDGSGNFTDSGQRLSEDYPYNPFGPVAVALGDLDGDGDLDAFVPS